MQLESNQAVTQKSQKEVFDFLNNIENFEKIMPSNIQKFEKLSDVRFLFQLKGMPEIVLEKKESHRPDKIVLGAASDKLPFTLTANIKEETPATSTTKLDFEGKFNAMMGMMIKSPIQNFINILGENISKL